MISWFCGRNTKCFRIYCYSYANKHGAFSRFYTNRGEIATAYNPKEVEADKISKWDIQRNYTANRQKPKFSMILPPPNVTGNLHLGHALMCTIGDVVSRRKLQQGYNVVWLPGMDHAGIATQVVVEKRLLKKYNLSRHQLGRDKFLEEVWKWKQEKEESIKENLKKLGCSLNWDMEYFTLDSVGFPNSEKNIITIPRLQNQQAAVQESFIRLFDEGLIKRKNSLVNWSCSLESAVSDIEVNSVEIKGPTSVEVPGYQQKITFGELFDIAYKVIDSNEEIIVSTTRPETLLGDVAIAVNPSDSRYTKYQGKGTKVWHPFRKKPIPIVFDSTVEVEFGTGAVKITPAHDKDDYELAQRHTLPSISVFTEKGRISQEFQDFTDLPRFEARTKIVEALASLNLLRGIKPHTMALPMCSRSKDVIEYMIRPQWFLQCQEIARGALEAVTSGYIKIIPSNFESEWFRWLTDCRDWCISRQLWWGHQIPAYLCTYLGKSIWVAATSEHEALIKASEKFGALKEEIRIEPDTDVLDTWFSSSLLPFSAFHWPGKNIANYYPLDVMITGHDILFFWVARMAMMGQKLTGDVPFRNVLLNGIVCDVHGRKMSKSLGNVVLPEQVIYGATLEDLKLQLSHSYEAGILSSDELKKSSEGIEKMFPKGIPECGTDALRFTLCSHNIKSHFINFDVSECHTNRMFFNKIWQATRYTLGSFQKLGLDRSHTFLNRTELCDMDKWILSRLANTKKICNQSLESYNFHIAVSALKTFFYSNFCDVYLETTKPAIFKSTEKGKVHCSVLATCLSEGLQSMTVFTPFLSEELLEYFPHCEEIVHSEFIDDALEEDVQQILEICSAIRQLKSEHQITKKHEPKVHIYPETNDALKLLCKYKGDIKVLSLSYDVVLENNSNHKRKNQMNLTSTASHLCSFGLTTNDLFVSRNAVPVLNKKKLEKLQKDLNKLQKTISSDGYKKSAKTSVQQKHMERLKQLEAEINSIKVLG